MEYAPEQWESQIESGENEATLIWSLGLLLFILMSKKGGTSILRQKLMEESDEPVDDLTLLITLWKKVVRGEWGEFLENHVPENYGFLKTLVFAALAHDPANRPTLAKWITALEGLY